MPATVDIAPTLAEMASLYRLSRAGGPKSPRFHAYVPLASSGWGFAAYNPMAGEHALHTVEALIALRAEELARASAAEVAELVGYEGALTLALVVASPGMWTDRIATEVRHRTHGPRRHGHGLVMFWAKEAPSAAIVQREAIAESMRVLWTHRYGAAESVQDVLAREGLACAAGDTPPVVPDGEGRAVADAVALLGPSRELGDVVGVLYGDDVCAAHGWPALGIPDRAGYRWAIARAAERVAAVGLRAALDEGPAVVGVR